MGTVRAIGRYYLQAAQQDVGFFTASLLLVMTVVAHVLGGRRVLAVAPAAHKHVLMVRDSTSEAVEVWCTFASRDELVQARDGLNRLYAGQKYFWRQGDEPPRFAANPRAFRQYMENWRSL